MEKESYFFSSRRNVSITIIISVIFFVLSIQSWFFYPQGRALGNDGDACSCVIFRFDDIRNHYLENVQIGLMDFFISNNVSVSFGLVANEISNNTILLQKIDQGFKTGLFEIAVHGWEHVDYTALTEVEQTESLAKANQKFNALFGRYPEVFIPPFNLFNNNTVLAMENFHFNVLSSAIYYDEPDILNSTTVHSFLVSKNIFRMPEMTDFSIYYNGTWVKVPVKFLLADIDFDIKKYGYSVVMVHPHNFATQVNGTLSDILDFNQLQSLNIIIDAIKNKNIPISTFSQAVSDKVIAHSNSS